MPELSIFIPEPLRSRLESLRPTLEQQGVIQRRKNGYRLRYREFDPVAGYLKHKSLHLGGKIMAELVESYITAWRDEIAIEAVIDRQEMIAERQKHAQIAGKRYLSQTLQKLQCGERRRRQIRQWLKGKDTGSAITLLLSGALPDPPKRGRPRKCRLW